MKPSSARHGPRPHVRRRPAHLSARLRLTLWYTGLFLVAGAILLALNYFLVDRSLTQNPRRDARCRGQQAGRVAERRRDERAGRSAGRRRPRPVPRRAEPDRRRAPRAPADRIGRRARGDGPALARARLAHRGQSAATGTPDDDDRHVTSPNRTSTSASISTDPTTSSRSSPTPSTRCWIAWRRRSPPSVASSPTRHTSCARHCRSSAPKSMSPSPIPMPRPASCGRWPKPFGMRPNAPNVLIDSLLVLARSDAGSLASEPCDLAAMVRAAAERAAPAADARESGLDLELEPAVVDGDRALLERIVATSSTTPCCTTSIADGSRSTPYDGNRVRLRVANSGGHSTPPTSTSCSTASIGWTTRATAVSPASASGCRSSPRWPQPTKVACGRSRSPKVASP